MKSIFRYSRRGKVAVRRIPSRHPAVTLEERAASNCPSANEVLGEIGITLAVHLAVALAITFTLQAYGIV